MKVVVDLNFAEGVSFSFRLVPTLVNGMKYSEMDIALLKVHTFHIDYLSIHCYFLTNAILISS